MGEWGMAVLGIENLGIPAPCMEDDDDEDAEVGNTDGAMDP